MKLFKVFNKKNIEKKTKFNLKKNKRNIKKLEKMKTSVNYNKSNS